MESKIFKNLKWRAAGLGIVWGLLSLAGVLISNISYAELVIIVHPSNPVGSLDIDAVRRVYLGKLVKIPNTSITAIPIDQSQYSEIRAQFNKKVIQMNPSELMQYWAKRIFTGKGGPPIVVKNSSEVIEAVSKNINAIGYIDSRDIGSGIKIVTRVY